jgi:MFS family permease
MAVIGHSDFYRQRDLLIYLAARFLSEAAMLAQSVAIGWTLYRLSNTPLTLGIVGIVQFVPMFLLVLPAGELCDRLSPRPLIIAGLALQCLCAVAFFVLTLWQTTGPWPFYGVLLIFGVARALAEPAEQALLPFLVPPERLHRAIASASAAWQIAVIAGPALGGLAYALGAGAAYAACGVAFLTALLALVTLGGRRPARVTSATMKLRVARVIEGIKFVRSQPVVLGAISLDLAAVLLGGATALMPVYARDILKVGPIGLGMLRSAPAVGACLCALVQVRYAVERQIGLKLFAAVGVFGLASVVFALSRSFVVSLTTLVIVGASDMVSVNIRSSLIQLATPDAMRGRVSAVNMLFIGASSELGAFESGLAAAWLGTVPAVLLGGIGTLFVAALWAAAFPALRKADRIHSLAQHDIHPAKVMGTPPCA